MMYYISLLTTAPPPAHCDKHACVSLRFYYHLSGVSKLGKMYDEDKLLIKSDCKNNNILDRFYYKNNIMLLRSDYKTWNFKVVCFILLKVGGKKYKL